MRKYALLAVLLLASLGTTLQAGIEFQEVTTNSEWKSTLKAAEKEGKLVFVDVYTDWCGWCVKMEKEIYSQEMVFEYYNEKFINVKINAEKGDGPSIMEGYEVGGYPAYLFVDSQGKAVRSSGGYQQAAEFKALGEGAVVMFEKLPAMQKSFKNGSMGLEELAEFANIASEVGDPGLLDRVVARYLEKVPKKEKFSATSFNVLKQGASDINGSIFTFLYKNKDKYISSVGEAAFKDAIKLTYMSSLEAIMETGDYAKLKKVTEILTPLLADKGDEASLACQTELYVYKNLGDWDKYKSCVEEYAAKETGAKKAAIFRDAADLIGRDFNLSDPVMLEMGLDWSRRAVTLERSFSTLFTRSIMEIRHDELRDALATLIEAEKETQDAQELAQLSKLKEMLEAQIQQQEE